MLVTPRALPPAASRVAFTAALAVLLVVSTRPPVPQLTPSLARANIGATILASACDAEASGDQVFEAFSTRLDGQLAIITGGYSGLGYALAEAMLRRGAAVVLAVRDVKRGEQVAGALRMLTGNSKVSSMECDLASFASVRAFARGIRLSHARLDYLVLNAGIARSTGRLSVDGFDELFQVDFLSHALLTELLIDSLRASTHGGTILSTSSGASENACESLGSACHTRFCECFADFKFLPPPPVDPRARVTLHWASGPHVANASTYGTAKWAQIFWSKAIAARELAAGSLVRAFSWTPSLAITPGVGNLSAMDPKVKRALAARAWTAEEAVAVPAQLIAAPLGAFDSGGYFSRDFMCEDRQPVDHGFKTEVMQAELLERVQGWVTAPPVASP